MCVYMIGMTMPHIQGGQFPQPDGNPRIWRYMDFAQFVSLLSTGTLYFARADKFGDDFEGTLPKPTVRRLRDEWGGVESKDGNDIFELKKQDWKSLKKSTFLNCWHKNEYESVAMWEQYSNEGIAIQSEYFRLSDSLGEIVDENGDRVYPDITAHINIFPVEYKNYNEFDLEGTSHLSNPYQYKRKSFEHESEIRAHISKLPPTWREEEPSEDELDTGLSVSVDLEKLIENVFVAPSSKSYVHEAVESVAEEYGLGSDIVAPSNLDERPLI